MKDNKYFIFDYNNLNIGEKYICLVERTDDCHLSDEHKERIKRNGLYETRNWFTVLKINNPRYFECIGQYFLFDSHSPSCIKSGDNIKEMVELFNLEVL